MHVLKTRLSVLVSTLLLAAAALTSVLIYLQELRNSRETIQADSLIRLNVLATQLQNVLYTRIALDKSEDALMNISVAAMTPGVRVIILADSEDLILLSSRYGSAGEPAASLAYYSPQAAAQVRQSGASLIVTAPQDENVRLGYYPLGTNYMEMGPVKRVGALYIEFDMAGDIEKAQYFAVHHAATYIGLTLASTAVIAVLLHFLIARRVRRISDAAAMLANGNLEARTGLTGRDEISQLGATFDRMVETMAQDSARRQAAEDQIRHLAFFDPLTQLPNRRLLIDRLGHALSTSRRSEQYGALIMLDLDHFKKLNDTKGHGVGDRLLVEVARRLTVTVREADTVSRLGGDEFVVVAESLAPREEDAVAQAEIIAAKIRDALAHPFDLEGGEYHCTPSIGMALFRGHDVPLDVLMKQADVALYQAKDAGRNAVRLFSPAAQDAIDSRIAMEGALRRALALGHFRLHYQPQVDHEGLVFGAEALLRWQDPVRGLVAPSEFIGVAEEMGLIIELGKWVMDTACAQLKRWESDPKCASLTISVNVSPRQFHQSDFVERVRQSLSASGADPARLKIELTENVVLEDIEGVIARMERLSQMGVRFSLDDFGTGYSSLSYLKRLPLQQIKIDQSFTRDIPRDPNDAAIVHAILAMGRSLDLDVIAEGVETTEQRDFLLRHGCRTFQGYLFGRPVPIEEWNHVGHVDRGREEWSFAI